MGTAPCRGAAGLSLSYDVVRTGEPLERREAPMPEPRGTEVLLRVQAAGVCHTDVHLWEGYFDLGGGKRLRMQERGIELPHTLGHESVGEVVALGPDAAGARVGDRRLIYPWIGCGNCAACRRGQEPFCQAPRFLGVFRRGGFAEHILVPHPRYLHEYGDLPPSQAAPLACSGLTTFAALKKLESGLLAGSPVLVIGAGGLGLMCLSVLRMLGGRGAIVVDIDPAKLDAAREAGAIAALDLRSAGTPDEILRLTEGGAVAALDLVGTPETLRFGLDGLAKGGTLVLVGMFGGEITLSIPPLVLRGLSVRSSYVGTPAEMAELMALVRAHGGPKVPIVERPLSAASDVLEDLRRGRIAGRAVLVPPPFPARGNGQEP